MANTASYKELAKRGAWVLVGALLAVVAIFGGRDPHVLPDDTPWHLMLGVELVSDGGRLSPAFSDTLLALDGEVLIIEGFMVPLEQSKTQRHFLLSAFPSSCPFCLGGGPESLIEVEAPSGVPFTYDAVRAQGVFHLQADSDVFFRLTEAREATGQ